MNYRVLINFYGSKRSSEMRNECYISCRVMSLRVLNEFLLNENAIERIYETLSTNFVGGGEILVVENGIH